MATDRTGGRSTSNGAPVKVTARQVTARRLRQLRAGRGLTAQQFADRCVELGATDVTRAVVANFESERRDIGIDRLLVFAAACDASPLDLLTPLPEAHEPLAITDGLVIDDREVLAAWLRGEAPLPGMDTAAFAGHTAQRMSPSVRQTLEHLVRTVITQQSGSTAHTELRRALSRLRSAIGAGTSPEDLAAIIDDAEAMLAAE